MPESKSSLRKIFLKIRTNISIKQAEQSSIRAAENFIRSVKLDNIINIALYYPLSSELSPLPLIDYIKGDNFTFCLPVVTAQNKPLEFYPWKKGEDLVNNVFYPQLLEPKIHRQPIIPDLILVPLVAFDEKLSRLGYGSGFYDRTIQATKKENGVIAIGYAFEAQKSTTPIPIENHDIKLDSIVTDEMFY